MYTIKRSDIKNIDTIMQIIASGREIMRSSGNNMQWTCGYPDRKTIIEDINSNNHYTVYTQDILIAVFSFVKGPDETYKNIYDGAWINNDKPYYVIHRLGKLLQYNNVFKEVLDFCFSLTDNIKADTHRDNHIMQQLLEKNGFQYCGIIYLLNGDERLAYQKLI